MNFKTVNKKFLPFIGGQGQSVNIAVADFETAARQAHNTIDQIANFDVDIFSILGMRNLSSFIGELFAASLISVTRNEYKKNPHQDGYPDLLLMDDAGQKIFAKLKGNGQLREKTPFSPFPNGGIEVKATCGSVPTPEKCRRMGLQEKPDIGDQRIGVITGYDWKAHHRETNNLIGILWDFIDRKPRIVAAFFSPNLTENDWGKIVQPKAGGGRTTSVSIMTRNGVKKMYDNWVFVINDPRYTSFLNSYNKASSI